MLRGNRASRKSLWFTVLVAAVVMAGVGYSYRRNAAASSSIPAAQQSTTHPGEPSGQASKGADSKSAPAAAPAGKVACNQPGAAVPFPNGPHGLTVLFPPFKPFQPHYDDVQKYLLHNPDAPVCGANFEVSWGDVDQGPGHNPRYDWSRTDDAIEPWIKAGKKVYLTVWGVGYGRGDKPLNHTPDYVLSQVSVLTCTSSSPAFWQPGYSKNYQAFMAALIQHYGNNPAIGYIRFGFGIGGENAVVTGFNAPECQKQLTQAGFSQQVWMDYLFQMLDYEKSLHSPRQLMVGLNVPNSIHPDMSYPSAIAARAAHDGIGFGSQGLQQEDIDDYTAGRPCTVDWCRLFEKYAGQVPLELQTIDLSEADRVDNPGSLADLLPFGIKLHCQNFEIYYQDWLTAFDPQYPGYAESHVAYQRALNAAADLLGR